MNRPDRIIIHPELWQLVEQWRKDNQPLTSQLRHLQVVNDLQRKLHERNTKTTTTDHTGEDSDPRRRDA